MVRDIKGQTLKKSENLALIRVTNRSKNERVVEKILSLERSHNKTSLVIAREREGRKEVKRLKD